MESGPGTASLSVVLLPGLGALGYLLPTVRAVASLGGRCVLLDLPGFGSRRPRPCPPTVEGIASATAQLLRARPGAGRLVLAGHSTGAQAALHAALLLQEDAAPAALVLAGPTVAPGQRSLLRLAARAPLAYRRDSPRELVVAPDYVRGGRAVLELVRSAVADRPEEAIARLRVPVTLTAGRHDAFAPAWWRRELVRAAGPRARDVELPGSHNNPWTRPWELAAVLAGAGA
nr:alpha/beta hydrolase [Motilibacter deserti]